MLIARYYNNHDVRVEEIPTPKIGEGEILVKVVASAICGTDVMEWYRIKKAPRILGHEIAGDIVESKSKKYKVGQRVFVSHHVACDTCKFCLAGNHTACETLHKGNYDPGGYSEYIRIPQINVEHGVYVLPDHVTYEDGTFVEPLACVLRGQRIVGVEKGKTVMILGAGVSGLTNIQVAKMKGATVIATDVDEYKLKKAKEYGADKALHVNDVGDTKADIIILCTGSYKAVEQAFQCIDRKGTILLFAIPDKNIEIPNADFWRNEVTLTSSYGAAACDLQEALDVIASEKINVKSLVTHRFPLTRIQEGFNLVANPKDSLKVIIEP